ncbi:MAG: hypothetical protein FVQ84_09920 [Planctomycetes bacterium]|nr:hypothetical protein [Planctomycetota bacterium]
MKSKNSLLMTDWAMSTGKIAKDFKTFIYELVLLSLIYDEILIQDEVFALSRRLSRWMKTNEDFRLLQECFEPDFIRVLTHPKKAFHTQQLQDLSEYNPIQARAKYIAECATENDKPFKPTKVQKIFYNKMDSLLSSQKTFRRPVGKKKRTDFRSLFPKILQETLSCKYYGKWRDIAFSGITPSMADDFICFIEEPKRALEKLPYKLRQSIPDESIFTRSLGFRLTSLYKPRKRNAMQRLIQTVFAAPFCENEDASGRYDNTLKEFVSAPEKMNDTYFDENEDIVSVQAHIQIPISLPPLNFKISKIISEIRETTAGQKLREAMKDSGPYSFELQKQAWKEVADELASRINKPKKVNIKVSAIQIAGNTIAGSIANGLYGDLTTAGDIPPSLARAFLGCSIALSSFHIFRLLQHDLKRQKLRPLIEKSVQFRCSRVLLPPDLIKKKK